MSDEADPAVLCAERQLKLLAEMAEFGMGLIRDLKAGEADTAEAFVRLSRAVRLTFALETKTHQELRILTGEIIAVREAVEAKAAENERFLKEQAVRRNKSEIRRHVLAVAESESESLEDYNAAWNRLEEKLDPEGLYHSIGEWQTRYAVERLCEDLGLHPDWDRWTGDGWALSPPSMRGEYARRAGGGIGSADVSVPPSPGWLLRASASQSPVLPPDAGGRERDPVDQALAQAASGSRLCAAAPLRPG
jgi:hypothetical protein